jgi:hypothetical protein
MSRHRGQPDTAMALDGSNGVWQMILGNKDKPFQIYPRS